MRLSTHKFQPSSSSPLSSVQRHLLLAGEQHKQSGSESSDSENLETSEAFDVPDLFLEQLSTFSLFKDAPRSFHNRVALKLKLVQYTPQEYILKEGDPALSMYWILKGVVSVTSTDGDLIYAELSPGAFFGEIGILFNRPRTATVVARSRVLVGVLTADALNPVLRHYPLIERRIRDEAQERLSMQDKKNRARTPILKPQNIINSDKDWSPLSNTIQPLALTSSKPPRSSVLADSSLVLSTHSNKIDAFAQIQEFIKSLPVFAKLSPKTLHQISLNAELLHYQPLEFIFKKGSKGSDIYFIMDGEVEITDPSRKILTVLKRGSYFGEMTFIERIHKHNSDATRSATVKSLTPVRLMVLTSDELEKLCQEHSAFIDEMEKTVNERCHLNLALSLKESDSSNLDLASHDSASIMQDLAPQRRHSLTFSLPLAKQVASPQPSLFNPNWMGFSDLSSTDSFPSLRPSRSVSPATSVELDVHSQALPSLDGAQQKKRRASCGSLCPLKQLLDGPLDISMPPVKNLQVPVNSFPLSRRQSIQYMPHNKRIKLASLAGRRRSSVLVPTGTIPDKILLKVFEYLDLPQLMRLRTVSRRWRQLLYMAPNIFQKLDLTPWNTSVTDDALIAITDFVGSRPTHINVSNCFHLTDEGFSYMVNEIGMSGKIEELKMRSIWEVSAMAIMDLSSPSVGKHLQHIDLSNCRKVTDNVVERLIGWTDESRSQEEWQEYSNEVGSRNLKSLSLGYCKSLTDFVMHHIASHANETLESLDLTRCTTITDAGFQSWTYRTFPNLKNLSIKDCTFLTDKSIISIANAAPNLTSLNLNFCCALLEIAVEVLCLGCQKLESLDFSFCGSAVSDSSLVAISLHLRNLQRLMVKGCIRVTRAGVDALLSGFSPLTFIDIGQCRNAHVYPGNIPAETLKVNSSTKSAFISSGSALNIIEMII